MEDKYETMTNEEETTFWSEEGEDFIGEPFDW